MKRSVKSRKPVIDTLEARTMLSAVAPHVVGYLPDYEYSSALIAHLKAANWEGLNQVNFFSVLPDGNGLLPGTSVTSNGSTHSNTTATTSNGAGYPLSNIDAVVTAAHAAGVKVDIVVGGAGSNSTVLGDVIESGNAAWVNFAASVAQFCAKHKLDGVDLDWEPDSVSTADIQDYGYLLGTLRQNTSGLKLSAAVNSEKLPVTSGGSAYVLNAEGVQSLDTINVMAYDLGNPGVGAPIATAEKDLTNWGTYAKSCQTSTSQNFKSKLIFGIPFYGKATTIPSTVSDPWSVANDSNCADATYSEIVAHAPAGAVNFSLSDSSNQSISHLSIPGTFNGHNSAATWNFDGRGTVAAKTTFALKNGYGGVLAWSIGQDYFGANGYDQNKSLLPAIQQAIAAYNAPSTPPAGSATVVGTVFNDANGNGKEDQHDSGLAGWTVYLDLKNTGKFVAGDPTAVTNSSGQFTFKNVVAGTYIVRIEQQTKYSPTTACSKGGDKIVATAHATTYCGLFGEHKIS